MLFFSALEIPKIVKFCEYTTLSICQCRLLLKVKFKSRNLPNFQLIGPHRRTSMSLSSKGSVDPTKLCSSVVSASDNTSLVRVLQSPLFHGDRHRMEHPVGTQHSQTERIKKSACKKSVSKKTHSSVAQNKKQSGGRNCGTTEMTPLAMTRGTRTATSHSSDAKNSGRISRGSAAKSSLITGAVSSKDTGVKRGTYGKDKNKKRITISSSDSPTSKVVETDHQHTPTASPLAQVEGDSPQTTKNSVDISSVSGQRVTDSGRQNMPSGERRRNGSRIGVKSTGRRAATGKFNGKTNKEVSSFSETDNVCTICLSHPSTPSPSSVAGYTNRRYPSSKQGGVSLTHWSKSAHSSHIQLPSTLRIPQRNLATTQATKGWSQGKRKLELKDIAAGLGRMHYRNVIVMSGAGISTPSGIPDFRTPGTGLYDNLQKYHLPEPSAVFDAAYFNHNPRPFFSLAKELYPGRFSPNLVHCFVRLLQDKGVLLRNYTQNIDGLERLAGVCGGKLVEAHGSFSTASCTHCHSKQDTEEVKRAIFSDQVPKCKHKYCNGVVKPDIVFFGEDLPQRFYSLQLADLSKCDLLLIMGTSLEVEPFASLVTLSRHTVPRLLLNRELVGPFRSSRQSRHTDVAVCGDIIDSVREVVYRAGWEADLKEIQQTISQHHAGTGHPCDSAGSTTCTQLDLSLKRLTLEEDAHPPQPPDTDSDSSSSDSSTSSVSSSESSSESD